MMAQQHKNKSTNGWYSPDFDKELGEELVGVAQDAVGCFECGAPSPKLRCSRCQLAKYCRPKCQKSDWKKSHKTLCKTYLENKAPQQQGCPGACVPVLLKSVGLISEPMFVKAMGHRQTLFLEAAAKSIEPIPMGFSCSVVDMFDRLRVVVAPSFLDANDRTVRIVPHILVEVVDNDQTALETWNQQGGRISEAAFEKVVDAWVVFHNQLREANIQPKSVSCGSGLFDRTDELTARLVSKGISDLGFMESVL